MTKLCLAGLGRTGSEMAKIILEQKNLDLTAVYCSPNSSKEGKSLSELIGIPYTGIKVKTACDLDSTLKECKPDVFIDFSNSEATLKNAGIIAKHGINMVIGTTGFSRMALLRLRVIARKYGTGILYAPNITLGVNVMMLLSNLAASLLKDYDFQITEVHHKYKKDAPSGTAVKIAAEVRRGLGLPFSKQVEIPVNAVRAGGVVGRHELMAAGENDMLEISHQSFSRRAFAAGALRAVDFIKDRSGYYEMSDVLELDKVLSNYLDSRRKSKELKLKETPTACL